MENRAKLTRIPSMRDRVEDTLSGHRNEIVALLSRYVAQGKGIDLCVVGCTCQLGDWEKDAVRTSHADVEEDT